MIEEPLKSAIVLATFMKHKVKGEAYLWILDKKKLPIK
jgi:hypothetical protein